MAAASTVPPELDVMLRRVCAHSKTAQQKRARASQENQENRLTRIHSYAAQPCVGPAHVDLVPLFPPIYDSQGRLPGSQSHTLGYPQDLADKVALHACTSAWS